MGERWWTMTAENAARKQRGKPFLPDTARQGRMKRCSIADVVESLAFRPGPQLSMHKSPKPKDEFFYRDPYSEVSLIKCEGTR